MSWNRDLQFWFTFKSVSFITGPSTSTSTAQNVDERDILDVTDLVCAIAAQALADLGSEAPQPQRKLIQGQKAEPEEKKFVKTAVELLQDLSSDELPISKCKLEQKVIKSGNRTFFVDLNKE